MTHLTHFDAAVASHLTHLDAASASHHMTYLEAAVVGLIQGVTELFPVSSLGHNVLLPALVGGSWATDLNVAAPESPYLAFIVGLHVATAIALLIYFWRDWIRIIGGFLSSVRHLRVETASERLAWMIILATIPVGIIGLGFEHEFRVLFGKPIRAAIFLVINGAILLAGELFRRKKSRQADQQVAQERELATVGGARRDDGTRREGGARHAAGHQAERAAEYEQGLESDQRLSRQGYLQATLIGCAQVLALLAGISRDGVTIVAGMFSGLARVDAARFAFLLATPVILAAGVLKVPDLMGPLGSGIRGQILVGSLLSGVGAYVSVRFLIGYFRTRTLTPFAIYCFVVGFGSLIYLGLIK
jgi:undecaprenyl-diphosphatase